MFKRLNIEYGETTLGWMQQLSQSGTNEPVIKNIISFITETKKSMEIIDKSVFLHPEEYFQDLLALRDLLAYGVLTYCLTLRPDVNFGVVPNHKTAMAIHFMAANNPKLRNEFA